MTQQARNLVWELDEHGVKARFVIHGHDAKFGGGSDPVFQAEGMMAIKLEDGRRVFAPAGSNPAAVKRQLAKREKAS